MFPLRPVASPQISPWPCPLCAIPDPQKLAAGHLVSGSRVAANGPRAERQKMHTLPQDAQK